MSGRRRLTIRSIPTLAAVAAVSLLLIPPASARLDGHAAATAATVTVKGGEFFLRLSTKSVAKPERVTFVFKNIGHVQHDFRINGRQTPLTQPGKTAKLVVTFRKKGKYAYKCTVPGHAAAGMKGVFTVR